MFQQGLISISAGNISCRTANSMIITASGSFLGDLDYKDLIEVKLLNENNIPVYGKPSVKPSVEADVHRSIYLNTSYTAVAHGHAPYALALAASENELVFYDAEGQLHIPQLPVMTLKETIGSSEAAALLPGALSRHSAVLIRGHGVFTAAGSLRQAVALLSTVEFSSKILYLKNHGI